MGQRTGHQRENTVNATTQFLDPRGSSRGNTRPEENRLDPCVHASNAREVNRRHLGQNTSVEDPLVGLNFSPGVFTFFLSIRLPMLPRPGLKI